MLRSPRQQRGCCPEPQTPRKSQGCPRALCQPRAGGAQLDSGRAANPTAGTDEFPAPRGAAAAPCPTFGRNFGAIQSALDHGLGLRVLLLQEVDGLPQVQQLRVLQEQSQEPCSASPRHGGRPESSRGHPRLHPTYPPAPRAPSQCLPTAPTFSSAVSARCRRRDVMLTRLCSKAATRLAWERWGRG